MTNPFRFGHLSRTSTKGAKSMPKMIQKSALATCILRQIVFSIGLHSFCSQGSPVANPAMINSRDRQYIRALLDDDYSRNKPEIFGGQIAAMLKKPFHPDFVAFVSFNYEGTSTVPIIKVLRFPDSGSSTPPLRIYNRPRVGQSGGRLELHGKEIYAGGNVVNLVPHASVVHRFTHSR
ncbi:hypothetical protein DFH07DRAFT_766651 [Mycena maculata]|uniref:Uncharacterized protein n=1 Tax=Mycena maculata TaxID=230809 RepID=A0AAD7K2R2_9AGAR|nr:hypothetical protein DFH07DRAFT_766651 [Mycena maculata]